MIRLEGVSKVWPDGQVAVHELDLEVPTGEIAVLVGPSGCGKTTTMKMINRLIEPTGGVIRIGGEDVTHTNPVALRRRIGYVIQSVGLFPHLSVAENVAAVPRMLGWSRKRIAARTEEMLTLVGLDPAKFLSRHPRQLSGGQQQRVGVARALAADPPVLLMDEPFGATDPITRLRLQREFRALQQELGKTVILVTHDFEEALLLADRIAVLAEQSRVVQYDRPQILLTDPADDHVRSFVGASAHVRLLGLLTAAQAVDPILDGDEVVAGHTSLREVTERLLAGAASVAVVDEAGVRIGGIDFVAIRRAVAEAQQPVGARP